MSFYFNKTYFALALIFFALEISIALFVKDRVVRPFVGDVLVVVLIYLSFKAFLDYDYAKIAFGAFLFACAVEILQYFDYVKRLGLENNRVLSVMLGRTFEWLDFAAYTMGFLFILFCEKIFRNRTL